MPRYSSVLQTNFDHNFRMSEFLNEGTFRRDELRKIVSFLNASTRQTTPLTILSSGKQGLTESNVFCAGSRSYIAECLGSLINRANHEPEAFIGKGMRRTNALLLVPDAPTQIRIRRRSLDRRPHSFRAFAVPRKSSRDISQSRRPQTSTDHPQSMFEHTTYT